jgi:hypothetical protein
MSVWFEVWAKDVDDTSVILQMKVPAGNDEESAKQAATQSAEFLANRGATDVEIKRVEE